MAKSTRINPIDLSKVRRYPIRQRANKTSIGDFGKPLKSAAGAKAFFASLPKFLKANDLNDLMNAVVKARNSQRPFHLLLGAHTIKVGLSPIFIDLMKRSIVTGLSFNGAGLVHDLELAFFGGTSEDVQAGLQDGSFGMAQETGELYAEVSKLAQERNIGLGHAGGLFINQSRAKNRNLSVFAVAEKLGLPVTVHIGIGTDIVNQHPNYDAARTAAASYLDFRILSSVCGKIDRGGVAANIGSAVMLPEVFLKALTVARNLNPGKSRLTTANFDMMEHYRPMANIVSRPTFKVGKGYNFVGHHEILVPLLAWGLKAKFSS